MIPENSSENLGHIRRISAQSESLGPVIGPFTMVHTGSKSLTATATEWGKETWWRTEGATVVATPIGGGPWPAQRSLAGVSPLSGEELLAILASCPLRPSPLLRFSSALPPRPPSLP